MKADTNGTDDGLSYTCTMVGGWNAIASTPAQAHLRQMRASFSAQGTEPFIPQLTACTDYVVRIPTPPAAGVDVTYFSLWDQAKWDDALWDQPMPSTPSIRNTGWVSIGETGYSHAPVIQVTVAQSQAPVVELISIDFLFERAGVNV